MSLLIKGMDIPKLYENEEHLWVPGWLGIGKDGKAIFCTGTHFDPNTIRSYAIEEVRTPHGRLIDADRLEDRIKNMVGKYDTVIPLNVVYRLIADAHPIIEAEE